MHFAVAWHINAIGNDWVRLNNALADELKNYSWTRPLSTFYVVKVASQTDWDAIRTRFQTVCATAPQIRLIMTPLMRGGRYDGYLSTDQWKEINLRAADDGL